MKIGLIGYGKMGKAIEGICTNRNHEIVFKITRENARQLPNLIKLCDVAIEFSRPESVVENIKICIQNKIPVVVGTTGWNNQIESVSKLCKEQKSTLFYASNFSIGVNLFFEVNKVLAKLMNNFEDYNTSITEIHHIHKLDAPSGTAITLAEQIIESLNRKTGWKLTDEIESQENLAISALRENEVPGTHIINYTSNIDEITIKHEAKNRMGFAQGAVLAAEFIKNKEGVFTMKDLLNL